MFYIFYIHERKSLKGFKLKISNNVKSSLNTASKNIANTASKTIQQEAVKDGAKKLELSFKGLASKAAAFVHKKAPVAANTVTKTSDDIAKTILKDGKTTMQTIQSYAAIQAAEAQQIAIQQRQQLEKLQELTSQLKKNI